MRLECSVRSPLTADQLAVRLAAVLVLGRGDVDDAPELVLAVVIADQHGQELGDVEADRDLARRARRLTSMRGGIDDEVVDALVVEVAMEPEAVAAGLVAGEDRASSSGRPKRCLARWISRCRRVEVASGDGRSRGFWAMRGGEGEVPGGPAQLEGEVERGRGGRGRIEVVGR